MEEVEEIQYREELLKWCDNIYLHWERMKPRFSKLFDLKTLEEWEESCRGLKEKLQIDTEADLDEYHTAKNLYEQWEMLYGESISGKEDVNSDVREGVELSTQSDREIELSDRESDKEDELIQVTINLEIPRQDLRKILLDYKMEV